MLVARLNRKDLLDRGDDLERPVRSRTRGGGSSSSKSHRVQKNAIPQLKIYNIDELQTGLLYGEMSKTELVGICRKRKLVVGGNITQLVKRLRTHDAAIEKRNEEKQGRKENSNCESCDSSSDTLIVSVSKHFCTDCNIKICNS